MGLQEASTLASLYDSSATLALIEFWRTAFNIQFQPPFDPCHCLAPNFVFATDADTWAPRVRTPALTQVAALTSPSTLAELCRASQGYLEFPAWMLHGQRPVIGAWEEKERLPSRVRLLKITWATRLPSAAAPRASSASSLHLPRWLAASGLYSLLVFIHSKFNSHSHMPVDWLGLQSSSV